MSRARHFLLLSVVLLLGCTQTPTEEAVADTNSEYLGQPAILLENGVLELKILPAGGPLADLVLTSDSDKLSPLWAPLRAAIEEGREPRFGSSIGHFVCVDGFGGTSEEERAAGLQSHGEAHRLPWTTLSQEKSGTTTTLVQSVDLPIVEETLERTVRMVDGEHVVYVDNDLTSHLGFDRPINWAEHATIGSPFLEPGITLVDMSANRAMTRPEEGPGGPGRRHRLTSAEEFVWPLAPTVEGGTVDLRAAPVELGSGDHTTHLMTVGGDKAWVTAHHPGNRLLFGYVYNTTQYPWMQIWENYPKEGMLARGLEFGTQAFDVPRREVVSEGKLFDTPLFQWLPAKSTFSTSFLMFFVETPEGFEGVSDVTVAGGVITVRDKSGTQSVTLPASLAE